MLDLFLKASLEETKVASAQQRNVSLLRRLPDETLMKIASGREKLAFYDGDGKWLDRFKGTPLFEQALQIEQEDLQAQMDRKAKSLESSERYREEDSQREDLSIKRKMLELDLAKSQEAPAQVAAPEQASPLDVKTAAVARFRANMRKHADDAYSLGGQAQEIDSLMGQGMSREEAQKVFKRSSTRSAGALLGITGGLYGSAIGGMIGEAVPGTNSNAVLKGVAIGGLLLGGAGLLGGRALGSSQGDKVIGFQNQRDKMRKHAEDAYSLGGQAQEIDSLMGQGMSREEAQKAFKRSAVRTTGAALAVTGGLYGSMIGGTMAGSGSVLQGVALGGLLLGGAGLLGGRALGASHGDKIIGYQNQRDKNSAARAMVKGAQEMGLLEKQAVGFLGAAKGLWNASKAGYGTGGGVIKGVGSFRVSGGAARRAGKSGFSGAVHNAGTYMGALAKKQPGMAAGLVAAPVAAAGALGYAAG